MKRCKFLVKHFNDQTKAFEEHAVVDDFMQAFDATPPGVRAEIEVLWNPEYLESRRTQQKILPNTISTWDPESREAQQEAAAGNIPGVERSDENA